MRDGNLMTARSCAECAAIDLQKVDECMEYYEARENDVDGVEDVDRSLREAQVYASSAHAFAALGLLLLKLGGPGA